jgi:hypothetical protein
MLQIAGFGLAWVKTQLKFGEEHGINEALKEIKFFADNGMESILTINNFVFSKCTNNNYTHCRLNVCRETAQ